MQNALQDSAGTNGGSGARQVTIFPNLLSGAIFFLLGLALLLMLPDQVAVSQRDVVNGRVFPRMLLVLMMACGAMLVVRDAVLLMRNKRIEKKTIDLGHEARAALIFAILLGSYLLASLSGMFILGACFCCVALLLYFRCKKKNYYLITLTSAVLIWACFRFILNVNF